MNRVGFAFAVTFSTMAVFSSLLAATVVVDPSRPCGPVKPVNGVGQPPLIWGHDHHLFKYLQDAHIPFSRLHDVGGMYGCGVFVDVPNVFRNFDADENDPKNYDFAFTDDLLAGLVKVGVRPFYRLGVTIENHPDIQAYRIVPPKDFEKWARICGNVIAHYTEGWANGFHYDVSHWEIWNEADLEEDPRKNQMWQGSFDEYIRLYLTSATYLKRRFPKQRIGGYASCGFYAAGHEKTANRETMYHLACIRKFLSAVREAKAPLDFFSFHSYSGVKDVLEQVAAGRKMLDEYGFPGVEMCLNEWLPRPSRKRIGTAEQAAEIAAVLVGFQNSTLDSAAIYDAKCGVGTYSPLFNCFTQEPTKAYYAFLGFDALRQLGTAVMATSDGPDVYAAAAAKEGALAVMIVNFSPKAEPLELDVGGRSIISCTMTDETQTAKGVPLPGVLPPYSFAVVKARSVSSSAVEIGKGWQIAIPDEGEKVVQVSAIVAANEIQRDLEEACGVKLPIVPAAGARSPAIWLGEAAAAKAGLLPKDLKAFDNVIAEKDGDIYLFGRDRAGRKGLGGGAWAESAIPTARAAARFLMTRAGVRFLMPGETGVEVLHRGVVTLQVGTFDRECPRQVYGAGRYHGMMYDMANNIFGLGTAHTYGGHSYIHACPASVGKEHPEYFGMFGGKRVVADGQVALCVSNPEVRELMVRELCKQFDAGADVCQLGQQDGFSGCECAACAAYGGEIAKGDWGEKLWIAHREIAERVVKLRPGKIVQIISYGPTFSPPKSFTEFPENVMIEMCGYTEKNFRAWSKYRVPHGYSVYLYGWGDYNLVGFTPRFSLPYLTCLAERFRRNNVKAIYRCGYGELFGLEGPAYSVFNTLLEEPSADVRKLVTDYCAAAFGPAAAPMQAFYERLNLQLQYNSLAHYGWPEDMETVGIGHFASTYEGNSLPMLAQIYTPDAVRTMEGLLVRAEKTSGLSEKVRRRLALVRMEWNYARNLGEIATLFAAYRCRPTQASLGALGVALRERRHLLDELYPNGSVRPRNVEGWPDCAPFAYASRAELEKNGRMGATLNAPLNWDVDFMTKKGVLPGVGVKRMTVARAKGTLGADIESGAWAQVPWSDLGGSQLQSLSRSARLKLAYDDVALYCAIESDLPAKTSVRNVGRDGVVWRDESVDVFVDPSGTREKYFHFISGPFDDCLYDEALGLITDPLHPKYRAADATWTAAGATSSNRRGGARWTCILRLPFADLQAKRPASGDVWCFNAGRTWDFAHQHDGGKLEYALWNPNLENSSFSAPQAMGEIVFE